MINCKRVTETTDSVFTAGASCCRDAPLPGGRVLLAAVGGRRTGKDGLGGGGRRWGLLPAVDGQGHHRSSRRSLLLPAAPCCSAQGSGLTGHFPGESSIILSSDHRELDMFAV